MEQELLDEAYMFGANMAVEYTKEIGKTDLASMTPQEVLTFAECMCKGYHIKWCELNAKKSSNI